MTDSYDAHVDDMAERITALGGTAMGSVQAVETASSRRSRPMRSTG